MYQSADITFKDDQFFVSGELSFFSVMSVFQKSLPVLQQCNEWQFDFSGLKSSDSGGLALIMEWIKLAKQENKAIYFLHLSSDILSLAKTAGLDSLIPTK